MREKYKNRIIKDKYQPNHLSQFNAKGQAYITLASTPQDLEKKHGKERYKLLNKIDFTCSRN